MFFNLVLLSFVVNQSGAYPVQSRAYSYPHDKEDLVSPESEAQYYLASFGYLRPELKNSSTASVSAETVRNAVIDFQSYFGLDPTGNLDEETLTWMRKPRCGLPDRIISEDSSTRRKRNIIIINGENRWTKNDLTFRIRKHSPDLEKSIVNQEIHEAFRLWEEVTPLTFTFVETGNVDIDISFESGSHSDSKGDDPFRGPEEVLAHAFFPRSGVLIHFDEAETWVVGKGTNLFQVAAHELGHALGLNHTNSKTDVMFATYDYRPDFKLETGDINRIQELYGAKISDKLLKEKFKQIASDMLKIENDLKKTNKDLEEAMVTIDNLKATLNEIMGDMNNAGKLPDIKNSDGKMPTSCDDLESMGHKINGIFLVNNGSSPNVAIDAVFCDFNPNSNNGKRDFQKWIGHVDVKSSPVYFYVQRNSPFYAFEHVIPFDFARVNIGNAMKLSDGMFTAPKFGTYFFSFTGVASFSGTKSPNKVQLGIGLYLDGDRVGRALADEFNSVDNQKCPLSLQATLNLEAGAGIWLQIDVQSTSEVFLYADAAAGRDGHGTQFTGWMLKEEILETEF